jgi:O-antigen/teichoic acid export membrane protein
MGKLLKKWHALPSSTKSSLAFMLSSFLTTGLSVITTPIFTRVIPQEQYGLVATYYSWLSIVDVFALLGLTSAGVFNVGLNDYRDKRSKYISSILTLCNLTTVVVFGILFLAKYFIGEGFMLPTNLLVLMFVHFIFSPANIFWITREKYEYRYKLSTLITVASSILSLGASVLFVLISKSDRLGEIRLWSSEAAVMLFYVPIYFYIMLKGKKFVSPSIWKQTLVFALPLIPHYLAQHVMASADMIMISELVSEADTGIYSVVSTIGKIATIVWSAINVSLIAITFEALNEKKYKRLHGLTVSLVLAYGVVCLGITLIAPEVLMLLAPADYAAGVYVVPPIACVSFITSLYNVYANVEFYYKKSFNIALATIVAAVLNIALNFILIPKFSYIGAAYTTLVSYVVLILMHYIGYRRATKDKVYNDKLMLAVSLSIIALCLVCNLLYINNIVRYVIVGLILILAVIKRKTVIQKLKLLYGKDSEN